MVYVEETTGYETVIGRIRFLEDSCWVRTALLMLLHTSLIGWGVVRFSEQRVLVGKKAFPMEQRDDK